MVIAKVLVQSIDGLVSQRKPKSMVVCSSVDTKHPWTSKLKKPDQWLYAKVLVQSIDELVSIRIPKSMVVR